MQVSAASSNLPLSTQAIKRAGEAAQAPGSPVTPEQVNKAVDTASDRAQQAQDNRAAEQTNRRSAAAQLYSANSQKNQIDTYLAVASEGEVESSEGNLEAARELSQDVQRYRVAEAADSRPEQAERPEKPSRPAEPTPYIDVQA